MKRLLCVVMVALMLAGCGGKPSNVSQDVYEHAVKALSVIDKFLDKDKNASNALQELDDLYYAIDKDKTDKIGDMLISSRVLSASIDLSRIKLENGEANDYEELFKVRNELAQHINKSERGTYVGRTRPLTTTPSAQPSTMPTSTPIPTLTPTPQIKDDQQYDATGEADKGESIQDDKEEGTVKGADVNMRSGPGTDYDVVAKVSEPAKATILEHSGDWYKVEVNGKTGYLRNDFVLINREKNEVAAVSTPAQTATATPKATPEPTHSETSTPKPEAQTAGQKNAARKAKTYLDAMPFSREGLIEQLKYEGYSTDEATYGADNSGADWKSQAVKKAKLYLEVMPFSRSGLIEQLEYDGFTREQAAYGVDGAGL